MEGPREVSPSLWVVAKREVRRTWLANGTVFCSGF